LSCLISPESVKLSGRSNCKIEYGVTRKGYYMSKSHDVKKDVRKKPQRTLKEKRLAKKAKREDHYA
jgi:hypothetical protein